MAEYQNLFTRVQVRAPAYAGVPLPSGVWVRQGKPVFSHLLGRIGDAQIGPIYLGWTGIASLLCGFIAIEIIGLNMLASVNWNPIQFIRQLPWLALEPPAPEVRAADPAIERGRVVADGGLLPDHFHPAVVGPHVPARQGAGHGHARRLGICRGDLAVPRARIHPPAADGQLERGGALRHLPAPRLDRGVLDPLRQPVLQPVPHAVDRLPVWLGAAVRDARRDHPRGQPVRR